MPMPELTRCVSARGDGTGAIAIRFESGDGRHHELDFSRAALRSLAPLMVSIMQAHGTTPSNEQPAALTSVRNGFMPDGRPVIGIGLNGVDIAVCFVVPGLLDELRAALAFLPDTFDPPVHH